MRREEKPWQMWYWKNLQVCWLKPDVGLNKWKVIGGPIHGADLIRSWHAVWPQGQSVEFGLAGTKSTQNRTGKLWSCSEISGLPNKGDGDNLDGLQSKAIAGTKGLEKSSRPLWVFEECNGRMTQTCWFGYVLTGCVCRGMLIPVHTYLFLSSQDNESLTRCLLVCKGIKTGGNRVKGKCNLNIVGKN